MLPWPSDSAALILFISASIHFVHNFKKSVFPVTEYWVRAIRGTRSDSTSVSCGYGKQNIFRDHGSNGEYSNQLCEWKTMIPCLRSRETGILNTTVVDAAPISRRWLVQATAREAPSRLCPSPSDQLRLRLAPSAYYGSSRGKIDTLVKVPFSMIHCPSGSSQSKKMHILLVPRICPGKIPGPPKFESPRPKKLTPYQKHALTSPRPNFPSNVDISPLHDAHKQL